MKKQRRGEREGLCVGGGRVEEVRGERKSGVQV